MPQENSAEDTENQENVWDQGDESHKKKSAPNAQSQDQNSFNEAEADGGVSHRVLTSLQKEIENLSRQALSLKTSEDLTQKEIDSFKKQIRAEEQNLTSMQQKISDAEKSITNYEAQVSKISNKVVQIKKLMTEFESVS